jgi:hypothetical protein
MYFFLIYRLPFASIRMPSSRSIISFHFLFVLLDFTFCHGVVKLYNRNVKIRIRRKKCLWNPTYSFSKIDAWEEIGQSLGCSHRKPIKTWIHCCNRSGVHGQNRTWEKYVERVQKKHITQHQTSTAFTTVGIAPNLADSKCSLQWRRVTKQRKNIRESSAIRSRSFAFVLTMYTDDYTRAGSWARYNHDADELRIC